MFTPTLPNPLRGSGNYRFVSPGRETLQRAISSVPSGTTLFLAPGDYEENVVIPGTKDNLTLVGMGGRGAVSIVAGTNGVALTNHGRDVTLVNIGMEGDGTGGGLVNTGRRFRAVACKIEGGADALIMGPGTVAQIDASSADKGDDGLFEDCEFAYATNGVVLRCSDYGASGQNRFRRCTFHNIATAHVTERVGTGGSAPVGYRDIELTECVFLAAEDGTLPTKFLDLNDDNANTGQVARCVFPVALNSGKSLVSTKVLWVANHHPAGLSNGQPS
jgi:hypothetical protein